MAHAHGFAAPLLGDNGPISGSSSAGVYGAGGSASGGGDMRYGFGNLTLLGGLGIASESYGGANMSDAFLVAAAARYVQPLSSNLSVFGELGGWWSPSGTYQFSRTYANGAGTATGVGDAGGSQTYLFARMGPVFNLTPIDEVAVSGEIARQILHTGGYLETITASNPVNAMATAGTDSMGVAKLRGQWTHAFAPNWDGTIWAAYANGFNYRTNLTATVAGVGALTPIAKAPTWGEYGLRIGYHATDRLVLEGFFDGTAAGHLGSYIHVGGGLKLTF